MLPTIGKLLFDGASSSDPIAEAILASPIADRLEKLAFCSSDLGEPAIARLKQRFGDRLLP